MGKLIEEMSKFTGMSETSLREIAAEVFANHDRIRKCPGPHNFVKIDGDPRHVVCTVCSGKINQERYTYYLMGLEDGKKRFTSERDSDKV